MTSSMLLTHGVTLLKASCICTSLVLTFSGVPDLLHIVKAGSVGKRQMTPFLAMALDTAVGTWFAALLHDDIGLSLRCISIVMCTAYLSIMAWYSPHRLTAFTQVAAMLLCFAIFAVALTATVPQAQGKIDVLGLLNTVTAISFAASPLSNLRNILATRDASSISLPMVAVLTLCAASWALYGAVLRNVWIILPNALNFGLGLVQVALALALPPPIATAAPSVSSGGQGVGPTRIVRTAPLPDGLRSRAPSSHVAS